VVWDWLEGSGTLGLVSLFFKNFFGSLLTARYFTSVCLFTTRLAAPVFSLCGGRLLHWVRGPDSMFCVSCSLLSEKWIWRWFLRVFVLCVGLKEFYLRCLKLDWIALIRFLKLWKCVFCVEGVWCLCCLVCFIMCFVFLFSVL
jgi:hypothetical protein